MFDAGRAFLRLREQFALGPRVVGTRAHARAQELLRSWLAAADRFYEHGFSASFFGREVECKNLVGHFGGTREGRVLLGAHYDCRPLADHDPDPARRKDPVPGANDGGSGVAVLAELVPTLLTARDRPSVDVVFFDAEDWHEVDGHEVSLGARRFVEDLAPRERPDAAIVVDMVGGKNLMLDVDVTCQDHDPSYALTLSLFQLGRSLSLSSFAMKKPHPYKWIGCDHTPFMQAGVPAALLMDLDYPVWHTTHDTPEHCSEESLAQIGALLLAYLERP